MTPRLYSAAVCPFAQRTRALLTELDVPFELVEVDLDARDSELLRLSPTGLVPFLVEGDFVLYESQVINEYLAERHDWGRAFEVDVRTRARQRLAMRRWDDAVVPAFLRSMKDPAAFEEGREKLERELDVLADTVERMGGDTLNLLGLTVAPFWARATWLADFSELPNVVARHEDLVRWLDATTNLACIDATLPDREETVERYREKFGRGGEE